MHYACVLGKWIFDRCLPSLDLCLTANVAHGTSIHLSKFPVFGMCVTVSVLAPTSLLPVCLYLTSSFVTSPKHGIDEHQNETKHVMQWSTFVSNCQHLD